jgi:hypothetical protein
MRAAAIVAMVVMAAVILAGPVLALGTSGKVTSIDGEKVVVLVGQGAAEAFPVGTRGVDIKAGDGASVRGRVVAAVGDKVTFRIMKGKASSLHVGASVELQRAIKAGSEEMQGC